jgi:5-methylcytosine-specific restriction endonuclease McrA
VKFKLHLVNNFEFGSSPSNRDIDLPQTRLIPSIVKQEVFKRDGGKCVLCGNSQNLHFDHDLAYKHGGTSLLTENIRLLCAKHNLSKGAKIE